MSRVLERLRRLTPNHSGSLLQWIFGGVVAVDFCSGRT